MTVGDGQVRDEGIDRANLNADGTQRVAHARRSDVIFARGREVLQRREQLGDLCPGSLRDDALQQLGTQPATLGDCALLLVIFQLAGALP